MKPIPKVGDQVFHPPTCRVWHVVSDEPPGRLLLSDRRPNATPPAFLFSVRAGAVRLREDATDAVDHLENMLSDIAGWAGEIAGDARVAAEFEDFDMERLLRAVRRFHRDFEKLVTWAWWQL